MGLLKTLLLISGIALFAFPAVGDEASTGTAPDGTLAESQMAAVEMPPAAPAEVVPTEPTLGPVGYDEEGRAGRIHVVVSGDTLWDISEAYLGTAWIWPSVWQDNPDVANPHRIYPGDRIWITPTEMRRLTSAEADAFMARGGPQAQPQLPAAVDGDAGFGVDAMPGAQRTFSVPGLEHFGFVDTDVFESAGSILGARTPSQWLAQSDVVYLSQAEGDVQVGDLLAVARAVEPVVDPETDRAMGVYVDALGWIEVTKVETESSEGVVRRSFREMEIGDRLLPRESMPSEVTLLDNDVDVDGQIAFLPGSRTVTGHYSDLVYLNRGTDHGLDVGASLRVFRPGVVAEDTETHQKHQLPDDVVADLLVVSAETETAVAIVTESREELIRGDRFRGVTP